MKEVIRALGLEFASPAPAPGVPAKEDQGQRERGQRRGEAELFVPRTARHCVRHHEPVLKDVSAGRTRLEEHEESGTVSRWKAAGWVSV